MPSPLGVPHQEHSPALEQELRAAFTEGAARYGLRALGWEIFRAAAIETLAERLGACGLEPTPLRARELLRVGPRADLVLLVAARHGDPDEAMNAFRTVHGPRVVQLYRMFGARGGEAEELGAELLETLTFGAFRRSAKPALLTYEAKAPIEHWLAGFVRHDWLSRRRAAGRAREVSETVLDPLQEHPIGAAAPAREGSVPEARELGALVEQAMRGAVETGAIADKDVRAYAHWVLSESAQFELAAQLGVDPATFSRRKARGQEALARCVKEALLLRLRGPEFLAVCRDANLELSESNLTLFQPIREFCRWVLARDPPHARSDAPPARPRQPGAGSA